MSAILLSPQYLPSIEYFVRLVRAKCVYFGTDGRFERAGFHNRTHIATSHGVLRLSIPLSEGRNKHRLLRDVRISYDLPWQRQHLQSLKTAYQSSPFFSYYEDDLLPHFQKKSVFLIDFNQEFIETILKLLKIKKAINTTEIKTPPDNPTSPPSNFNEGVKDMLDLRHLDLPEHKRPTNEKTPVSAVKLPIYRQTFEEKTGFLPNLSVLDLLFHCGNNSFQLLKNDNQTDIPAQSTGIK